MAEGITGQSLAGLLDLDMTNVRALARSGIVIGSGVRGRYLLASRFKITLNIYGKLRLAGKAMN